MKRFRVGKPDVPSPGVKETTAPTRTPAISPALRYHNAIATPCYPCRSARFQRGAFVQPKRTANAAPASSSALMLN